MQNESKRDQKGVWQKVASCLYRYRSKGTYYAVVRRSGKLIRKSLETTDLPTAKRKLRDFLNEQEDAAPDAHNLRFDAFIDDFVSSRTGAPKTLRRYQDTANRIKATWPGGVRQTLRNIDKSQCTRWLAQFNGQVATHNLARQWLIMFFDYAVANKKLVGSPMVQTRALTRPKPIRNAPKPEEFDRIVEDIRSQRFTDHAADTGDLVEFMGRAGIGQAEAAGLQWQHVDLEENKLKLFRAKTKTAFTIPIYPKLRPLLERLRVAAKDAAPSDPVFKIADPKKALAAACARLKMPDFSPRSLRRMFVIEALNKGVAVKTVAEWQGHGDGGVLILRTYSEVINNNVNQTAAQLLA